MPATDITKAGNFPMSGRRHECFYNNFIDLSSVM